MNLFLDDERLPSEVYWCDIDYLSIRWLIVKNFEEFTVGIINNGIPEIVSLDNDLQEEKEGYDCLKWLILRCDHYKVPLPKFFFHTKNNIAKENMETYLNSYSRFRENNGKEE